MRVVFNAAAPQAENVEGLHEKFKTIAARFSMTWSMRPADERKRVALMVSRFDHCLVDLLYRWRSGELPMDPVAIVANHSRETYAHIDFGDIPFHYLPITRQTKMEREAEAWEVIKSAKADLVVLARYMQICRTASQPSFKGVASTSIILFCRGSRARNPEDVAHDPQTLGHRTGGIRRRNEIWNTASWERRREPGERPTDSTLEFAPARLGCDMHNRPSPTLRHGRARASPA